MICGDGGDTCENVSVVAGWFGFTSTVAAVVGGFVMGAIADSQRFCRHMKLLLLVSAAICFACFCWFIFSVPTPLAKTPLLGSTTAVLGVAITACGFSLGLLNPLYYELGAEVTYPTPEQYSAGVITLCKEPYTLHTQRLLLTIAQTSHLHLPSCVLVNNGLGIVFIYCQPYFSDGLMNCAMFVTVAVTGLMMLPVKERYLRRDDDERKKMGDGVQALGEDDVQEEEDGEKEDEEAEVEEPSGNGVGRKSQYKQRYALGNGVPEEL